MASAPHTFNNCALLIHTAGGGRGGGGGSGVTMKRSHLSIPDYWISCSRPLRRINRLTRPRSDFSHRKMELKPPKLTRRLDRWFKSLPQQPGALHHRPQSPCRPLKVLNGWFLVKQQKQWKKTRTRTTRTCLLSFFFKSGHQATSRPTDSKTHVEKNCQGSCCDLGD